MPVIVVLDMDCMCTDVQVKWNNFVAVRPLVDEYSIDTESDVRPGNIKVCREIALFIYSDATIPLSIEIVGIDIIKITKNIVDGGALDTLSKLYNNGGVR